MPRLRLVVLVSGRGTNLGNLLAASKDGRMDADVVHVISNRPDVGALDIAKRHEVPTTVVPSRGLDRETHEAALVRAIDAARPDLVVLAGYMRILTSEFIQRHEGCLINIHPSLLPAFPGLDAQGQAARAGVRIAGCTTHFVTEDVDAGPVIMQAAVGIPPGASVDDVIARILEAEHRIYPTSIDLIAKGKVRYHSGRVELTDAATPTSIFTSPEARP